MLCGMAETYSTTHLTALFGVAPQSIRNWGAIFVRYLSTAAAPGKGHNRTFTTEDVSVFALIVAMKKNGASNEEIHASLSAGIRGSLPDLPAPSDIQAMAVSDHAKALLTLRQQIEVLQVKYDEILSKLGQSEEKNIQLESKNDLLTGQLKAAQDEIKLLSREIGKLESRLED